MATQTVLSKVTQAQNILIRKAEAFPSCKIPVDQVDSMILEISKQIGISPKTVESEGMTAGIFPPKSEIEIFRFKQGNQPKGERNMSKVNLEGKLRENLISRLRIVVPFLQPDLSYGRGKAKEALEALKSAKIPCSQATLNNDIGHLRKAGVTSLEQIDLDSLEVASASVFVSKRERKYFPDKKVSAKRPVLQLSEAIQRLEAEIAEKHKDLEVLRTAAEILKRRGAK